MKESVRYWGGKLGETSPPQVDLEHEKTPRDSPKGPDPGRLRPDVIRHAPLNLSELPYPILSSPEGASIWPSLGLDFKGSGPGV